MSLLVGVIFTLLPFKIAALFFRKKKKKQNCTNKRLGSFGENSKISTSLSGDGSYGSYSGNGRKKGEVEEKDEDGEKKKDEEEDGMRRRDENEKEEGKEEIEDGKLKTKNELKFLELLLCFSGGVFLGTFLLHFFPEVKDILTTHVTTPFHIQYPVAEVLIGGGFFLMMMIDIVVMGGRKWCGIRKRKKEKRKKKEYEKKMEKEDLGDSIQSPTFTTHSTTHATTHSIHHQEDSTYSNTHPPIHAPNKTPSNLSLVLALSLHHVFEGLSIGLQRKASKLVSLTVAVLIHESVICFCLGLQFFKVSPRWVAVSELGPYWGS